MEQPHEDETRNHVVVDVVFKKKRIHRKCEHGKIKPDCRICSPHRFCQHDRRVGCCRDCGTDCCLHKKDKKIAENVRRKRFANTTCKNSIARTVHRILYVNMIKLKDVADTVIRTAVHITKKNHITNIVRRTRFANTAKAEAYAEIVTQIHSVNTAVGRHVVEIVQ